MSNDSTSRGYLTPTNAPLTEIQLEDVTHDMLVGVTGLPGALVRPRWQPHPPKQPERDVDWCAFGLADDDPDQFAAVVHLADGDGQDVVINWETLNFLASFYGPRAWDLAGQLRAGLAVGQNRAMLRAAGLAVGEIGRRVKVPELVNGAWVQRVDLPLALRNETRRTYGVRHIVCGLTVIETDTGLIAQTTPMNEEGLNG